MPEWLVELRGHEFDLKTLADLFTTDDCLIFEEGGEFRLKSDAFDSLGSDAEVYARAKSLLVDINGAASVYGQGYRNVNLAGGIIAVGADGNRKRSIFEAIHETLRLSDSAAAEGGVAGVKGPTPADQAIKAARKEEVVSRALHFFSQSKSWVNLYKVLDAIRDDLGSLDAVKKKNWVPAGEIGRFTGTANNHTAASGEARHGFDYGGVMTNRPMTLAEAEELIRTLLKEWLKSK